MSFRIILISLCLAGVVILGPAVNPAHAQGCIALELMLDQATAAWDAALHDYHIANAQINVIGIVRARYLRENPDATSWPAGLTDADLNQAYQNRDNAWSTMNSLEAQINDILDQLLTCEDPPACDGAGHIH